MSSRITELVFHKKLFIIQMCAAFLCENQIYGDMSFCLFAAS